MSRPRVGFRPCQIGSCTRHATSAKGTLCQAHYQAERRELLGPCLVEGCSRKAFYVNPQMCGAHYQQTPRGREVVLRNKYGMKPGDYEKLMAAQNNSCAICGVKESVGRGGQLTRLCVDHNHETGQVRGLLCAACNKGLGIFKDDFRLVANAAAYLIKKDKTVMKKMQETR